MDCSGSDLRLLKGFSTIAGVRSDAMMGTTGVLMGGGTILAILGDEEVSAAELLVHRDNILDVPGCVITPGLVDMHVHVIGGGGEAGPSSCTPQSQLSNFLEAGVTTVVGVLGTDCITRRQESLVGKCRALNEDGITAYHWCGSYRVPPATITGSIQGDICLIESCIGVGEVAVSDHRSSAPTAVELAKIASEARVGGMLGKKAGLVHVHMGTGEAQLQPLYDALEASNVPITQFLPTHMERNPSLVNEAKRWIEHGGYVDFTAGTKALAAISQLLLGTSSRGHDGILKHCSISSDSFGSLPVFDAAGQLVKYEVAEPKELFTCLQHLFCDQDLSLGLSLDDALALFTVNPARRLKLPHKGRVGVLLEQRALVLTRSDLTGAVLPGFMHDYSSLIAVGCDADILVLTEDSLELQYVFARGELVRTPGWVRGGAFERGRRIRPRTL